MYLPKINAQLLLMKLHFFLYNAGIAPLVPFLPTYARQLGFSSATIGIINAVVPFFGIAGKLLLGLVSDHYKWHKHVFSGVILLTALSAVGFYYTPGLDVERKVNVSSDVARICGATFNGCSNTDVGCQIVCPTIAFSANNISLEKDCLSFAIETPLNQTVCDISCSPQSLNELIATPTVADNEVYAVHQFWLYLLLMIACWVGQAVTISLGDAICFELLGDNPSKYGEQRLFGSLGWGVFCVLAGYLTDATSRTTKNYALAFFLAFAILLLNALIVLKIAVKPDKKSASILKDTTGLLLKPPILVYLLWVIAMGMCTGVVWQSLFWLLEDLANARGCQTVSWIKTLQGLAVATQALLGEIPFLFFSGWILKKLGHAWSMSLVLLAMGVKLLLYSLISNPWLILPVELTNGLTIGLFYACMVSYASVVAPEGTEATVQGMVGAAFDGGGVAVGSLLSGYLYGAYGGPLTFRIFGVGALVACVLYSILQYVVSGKVPAMCGEHIADIKLGSIKAM